MTAAAFGIGFLVAAPVAARVMLTVNGMKTSREYASMKECEAVRDKIAQRRATAGVESRDSKRGRDDNFRTDCRPRVY